ncbi:DNA topoisomerase IV subunit A [Caryophanon latum]|uniref:DNA topoisomerase 4 subunit A n=1 Tax=Caryophanon latum TaxID=33977 RepID=A0A1C0YU95_9BACL|nr:DNA topoisomerase IV subunit A [Caryophanon latum]OCS90735.1 DNA topoisomerase IV subunit A [Caryophanon latum]
MTAEKFQDLPLEEIVGDRFGRYSKYIIQDRALPDARDGLKPVQRRILYAMFTEGNTFDKPFRKSAKTVGHVIGNFHPHGDTSVYEAMVRMSQDWKSRHALIDMHGNNGSIDGDPAAAMRYTEARLSGIAAELLRDIQKQTVDLVPNFDDQDMEPTVLPARFPNLLVSGSTGISAGYATDIPPHNLAEVLDGVLHRLDNPESTVDELMQFIKGPDFPTGSTIMGVDGIKKAYETGRGKIIVRAKTAIEPLKGGKEQIVITEIPYDVNKANLVKKMDEQRSDKRLEGIAEVRDESDRDGLRIVVELKKDVNAQAVLQYLLKVTDLQVAYNFNMIAIHNRRPTMMTLPLMLDAYIEHQKEVVTRRSQYDLQRAKDRMHIVEGLVKALSVLDQLIETIRASSDKRSAKDNIIDKFDFTEVQAEAIVSLQLYRLTNTDITQLEEEQEGLQQLIDKLEGILSSDRRLTNVLKAELKDVRKRFAKERASIIQAEIDEIKLTMDVLIPSEETIVTVTKDGYVKRTSPRSYNASNGQDFAMKESDYLLLEANLNTQHHLLLFTSKGNFIYQPVYELPDIRWKDLGQHISSIISLDKDEEIIQAIGLPNFDEKEAYVVTATKLGQMKRTALSEYKLARYNKAAKTMNVKAGDDMIYAAVVVEGQDIVLFANTSYAIRFPLSEIPPSGLRTGGVKAFALKEDEYIASVQAVDAQSDEDIVIVTNRGHVKRMALTEIEVGLRAKRGVVTLKELKANPHRIFATVIVRTGHTIELCTTKGIKETISVMNLTRTDRYSNGSPKIDIATDGELVTVKRLS